jgi:hypothetical protein
MSTPEGNADRGRKICSVPHDLKKRLKNGDNLPSLVVLKSGFYTRKCQVSGYVVLRKAV